MLEQGKKARDVWLNYWSKTKYVFVDEIVFPLTFDCRNDTEILGVSTNQKQKSRLIVDQSLITSH